MPAIRPNDSMSMPSACSYEKSAGRPWPTNTMLRNPGGNLVGSSIFKISLRSFGSSVCDIGSGKSKWKRLAALAICPQEPVQNCLVFTMSSVLSEVERW